MITSLSPTETSRSSNKGEHKRMHSVHHTGEALRTAYQRRYHKLASLMPPQLVRRYTGQYLFIKVPKRETLADHLHQNPSHRHTISSPSIAYKMQVKSDHDLHQEKVKKINEGLAKPKSMGRMSNFASQMIFGNIIKKIPVTENKPSEIEEKKGNRMKKAIHRISNNKSIRNRHWTSTTPISIPKSISSKVKARTPALISSNSKHVHFRSSMPNLNLKTKMPTTDFKLLAKGVKGFKTDYLAYKHPPALFKEHCLACGEPNIPVEIHGERHICLKCRKMITTPDNKLVTIFLDDHQKIRAFTKGKNKEDPYDFSVDINNMKILNRRCYATFAGCSHLIILMSLQPVDYSECKLFEPPKFDDNNMSTATLFKL